MATRTRQRTPTESAYYWLNQQRQWIEHCGGNLSGYLAMNPGQDPEQTKAIYEADMAALAQREAAVREVHLRTWGVRRRREPARR